MSKRALHDLVKKKIVRGWDDPRIYTLIALRRRGVPPGAILAFINELGVTTAKSTIQIARFEQSIRRFLETSVPRVMLVLDPVPLVIEGFEVLTVTEAEAPFSKDPSMGSHMVRLTQTVYIDRSDFREVANENFFRLAPGKTVGLLQFPTPITVTTFRKDDAGRVCEIRAVLSDPSNKPKTYIQWVPDGSASVEVRVYDRLFNSDNLVAAPGCFLEDINPNSEIIYHSAMIETGLNEIRRSGPWPKQSGEINSEATEPESIRFQAMRVGYFVRGFPRGCRLFQLIIPQQAIDKDSNSDRTVLNRIVSLKADAAKN